MKFILIPLVCILTSQLCFSKEKITIPLQYMPQTLEPALCNDTNGQFLLNNIADGLISWSYDDGISAQISSMWTESKDGELVFTLRDNLVGYDGQEVTCVDISKILNYKKNLKGPFENVFKKIISISCIDKNKIKVNSKLSSKELLYFLAGPQTKIISFKGKSIDKGIGPFNIQFKSNSIILRKNIYYYNAKDIYLKVIDLPIMDDKLALDSYQKGTVDLILLSNMDKVNANKQVVDQDEISSINLWATWGIAFNQKIPPFDDKNLRQCLIGSVKTEDWISKFYPNNIPAYGPIPFGLIGHARTRIASAESRYVKSRKLIKVFIPKEIGNSDEIGSWIKNRFLKCAKPQNMEIEIISFEKMLGLFENRKMGAFLMSFNKESIGNEQFYRSFYINGNENFYSNYSKNTENKINKIGTDKDLKKLSDQIALSLNHDAIMIPLMHPIHKIVVRKCLSNLILNPINEGYFLFRWSRNTCS